MNMEGKGIDDVVCGFHATSSDNMGGKGIDNVVCGFHTTSGKWTLSPGCPRTAQDVLETQRHQRYKAPQVAPRARSKMLTSLSHPGSFLGHPGPSQAILRHVFGNLWLSFLF